MSPFVHMGLGDGAVFVTRALLVDVTEAEVDLCRRGECPPERIKAMEFSLRMAALELRYRPAEGWC